MTIFAYCGIIIFNQISERSILMALKQQKIKNELRIKVVKYLYENAVGKKLPPERKISDSLGYNRYLIRECVEILEAEGILERIPRRGMFLRQDFPWKMRVGLILAGGQKMPYLDRPAMYRGIIGRLEVEEDILIRMILPDERENIFNLMKRYDLDGAIWVDAPGLIPESVIRKNMTEPRKIVFSFSKLSCLNRIESNCVTLDLVAYYRNCVQYLLETGCHEVMHITKRDSLQQKIFREQFLEKVAGKGKLYQVENVQDIAKELTHLSGLLDAVFCEGAAGFYPEIFRVVSTMPQHSRPLIVMDNNWRSRKYSSRYPELKVSFPLPDTAECDHKIGQTAVEMLLQCIETRTVQKAIEVLPGKNEKL